MAGKQYLDKEGLKAYDQKLSESTITKSFIESLTDIDAENTGANVERLIIKELQGILYGKEAVIDGDGTEWMKVRLLTQDEYDLLTPDKDVIYYIVDP